MPRSPTRARPRLLDGVVASLLLVATGLVFAQVRAHDFVSYDDPLYVSANPAVQGGLHAASVLWAFTTFHAGNWHPLTWLSFLLEGELFGLRPGVLHLTNAALHALDVLLLYALLRRLTGALWRPALVAALFALHPLHVESVAWIAERKDVLSTAFGLLSLLAYAAYAQRGGALRYLACFACLALGLMAKAMLVTWPFVFLLLDYGPLERLPRGAPAGVWLAALRSRVAEKLPFFALSLIASALAVRAQQASGALVESLALGARLANAAIAYVWYLGKALWPSALVPLYPHAAEGVPLGPAIGCALLLGAITALLLGPLRRERCLSVGWLCYLGTLVPVIGLVQVGAQATADRYSYVPLIGIFAIVAWGLGSAVERWPRGRPVAVAGCVGALLALGVAAHAQTSHWRNSLTLFGHALAVAPPNPVSEMHYGSALQERGRLVEAIPHYRAALALDADFEFAQIALGSALMAQGRSGEALPLFEAAAAQRPEWDAAFLALGDARLKAGQIDGALDAFRRAIELAPGSAAAQDGAGRALARKGRVAEAQRHFEEALRLDPELRSARRHLGALGVSEMR